MNRKTVYVAEDNITVSFEVTPEKPFNKCFQCPSFRNGCSGPNIIEMEYLRACEFLQLTRIFLHWSYQYVADGSKVSLATVKRLLTGKLTDPSYYTMRAVSHFLVGDPNGKSPCSIPDVHVQAQHDYQLDAAMRELERAPNDNKDYRSLLDKIHETHQAEMQTVRSEAQAKIDYLRQQVAYLQQENLNLWTENNRKSRLVDMFIEKQNSISEQK